MTQLLFIGGLGTSEVVLILALFLLFFGAKKIPDLAKGLGRGIREFKDASQNIQNQINDTTNADTVSTRKETEATVA